MIDPKEYVDPKNKEEKEDHERKELMTNTIYD